MARRAKMVIGLIGFRPARGTFLTPWFVAGVGLVVVALVALQSPHPVLSFAQPDQQDCRHPGCTNHRSGSLTSRRQVKIKQPRSHRPGSQAAATAPQTTPSPAPTASAPRPGHARAHRTVTISFQVLQVGHGHKGSGFTAFITLHSSWKIGRWTLRFTLPGTHIHRVIGASWQESASGDGGVAVGQPWPWPHAGDTMVRITVLGTGRPGTPVGCVFDRVACTFNR